MVKKVVNRVFIGFINGIVILLPVIITAAIIRYLVIKVNSAVLNPLMKLFAPMTAPGLHILLAKTVIFVGVIMAIAFIGWGARIIFINRIFSFGESILLKVPIMGRIYNAIKQISRAFLGHGKTVFKQVVLVEYPRQGIYSLGFTTGVSKGEIKSAVGEAGINVFIPTTPNPTSGMFIVLPKEDIHFLKMSVEEGMKMVISGGSVSPYYEGETKEE